MDLFSRNEYLDQLLILVKSLSKHLRRILEQGESSLVRTLLLENLFTFLTKSAEFTYHDYLFQALIDYFDDPELPPPTEVAPNVKVTVKFLWSDFRFLKALLLHPGSKKHPNKLVLMFDVFTRILFSPSYAEFYQLKIAKKCLVSLIKDNETEKLLTEHIVKMVLLGLHQLIFKPPERINFEEKLHRNFVYETVKEALSFSQRSPEEPQSVLKAASYFFTDFKERDIGLPKILNSLDEIVEKRIKHFQQ
mmetsp:Transcript_15567/g.23874  ORF Transcript_15567/g.23874 Transcript_15567/m.23874 type:complete len:249 (-) Transcript_15567:4462-5208(-)